MKKLVSVFAALFAMVSLATVCADAIGAPYTVKKVPPPGAQPSTHTPSSTMAGRRVEIREPSGVYGWFVLTDPATGERWYPTNDQGQPRGTIRMTLQFRKLSDGSTKDVSVNSGNRNLFQPDAGRNAWRYAIRFDHDTTWEADPRTELSSIKYSPNVWHFNGIVGTTRYRILTPIGGGRTRVDWETVFQRHSGHFADLPDVRP
jgi:hypothetical protein